MRIDNCYVSIELIRKGDTHLTMQPLIIAIVTGISYGTIRTAFLQRKDQKNKKSNPYLESIIVTLAVYLISSLIFQ